MLRLAAFLALLPMLAGWPMPLSAQAESRTGQLTVTGTGHVSRAPDLAIIRMAVDTRASTAARALRDNEEASGRLRAEFARIGLSGKDVVAADLSLNPVWAQRSVSGEPARIVGYAASNRFSLRLHGLERLADVLDRLTQVGANRIDSIGFSLQNIDFARDSALQAAVADARRRAAVLATASGVKLGRVLSVNATSGGGVPMVAMREMAADAAPITPGQMELSATVTMVFEISEQ